MSFAARHKIRHSLAGRCARIAIHAAYRALHPNNLAVAYRLPGEIEIKLYPEGEVAEFLAFETTFERTELALVGQYLRTGMQVVDVGANIGLYSILADKLVGEYGVVWAFEPSTETRDRLRRNLALNGCERVRINESALCDMTNVAAMLTSDNGFGDAYRYLAAEPHPTEHSGSLAEEVMATTLDDWAESEGIRHLDFLKVDIEGGEYRMFQGARRILKASPNLAILFECEPDWCARAGNRQEDVLAFMNDLGFHVCAWNKKTRQWATDTKSLLTAGMLWACRDPQRLLSLSAE